MIVTSGNVVRSFHTCNCFLVCGQANITDAVEVWEGVKDADVGSYMDELQTEKNAICTSGRPEVTLLEGAKMKSSPAT